MNPVEEYQSSHEKMLTEYFNYKGVPEQVVIIEDEEWSYKNRVITFHRYGETADVDNRTIYNPVCEAENHTLFVVRTVEQNYHYILRNEDRVDD